MRETRLFSKKPDAAAYSEGDAAGSCGTAYGTELKRCWNRGDNPDTDVLSELFVQVKNGNFLDEYVGKNSPRALQAAMRAKLRLDYERMGLLGYSIGASVASRYVNSFPKLTTGAPFYYPYPAVRGAVLIGGASMGCYAYAQENLKGGVSLKLADAEQPLSLATNSTSDDSSGTVRRALSPSRSKYGQCDGGRSIYIPQLGINATRLGPAKGMCPVQGGSCCPFDSTGEPNFEGTRDEEPTVPWSAHAAVLVVQSEYDHNADRKAADYYFEGVKKANSEHGDVANAYKLMARNFTHGLSPCQVSPAVSFFTAYLQNSLPGGHPNAVYKEPSGIDGSLISTLAIGAIMFGLAATMVWYAMYMF